MNKQLFIQLYNENFQYTFSDYSIEDDQLIKDSIENDFLTDDLLNEVLNNNEVYFKESCGLTQEQIDSLY